MYVTKVRLYKLSAVFEKHRHIFIKREKQNSIVPVHYIKILKSLEKVCF
jgi:hypothetical protein